MRLRSATRSRFAVAALALACASFPGDAAGATGHDAPLSPIRVPLAPLGYQALAQDFLLAGSSMLTVDFVDNDHLLITFSVRRLMKREANDPVDDTDRTIGASLVELPSGKVLARTEWRLHDHSQYLWNLGHGRFLLRVRDRLTMIAPLASGDPNDAFHETPLLQPQRHIVAVLVSSDADLLTVETTKWAMGAGDPSEGFSAEPAPVEIGFYRLDLTEKGLVASSAGTIRTRTAVALPVTAAGFLEILEGGKDRWLFNFDEHAGKVNELAEFDTSCVPRPTFVGNSEFVVFGCRGAEDKVDFAGFNMQGEEMWQQNFYDQHVNPTFSFAPGAGRFALGRTIVSGDFDPELPLPSSMVTAQEVRVYQSYNGKLLFKTECTPVERAGQNFALSPDGLRLAVVRELPVRHPATRDLPAYTQNETTVEVYALPPLAAEDKAAVKAAQTNAPRDVGARIDTSLARLSRKSGKTAGDTESAEKVFVGDAPAEPPPPMPSADAGSQAAANTIVEGDVQPTGPRKPPTLYGPDEKHPNPKPQ
jgi:hypothetical protein